MAAGAITSCCGSTQFPNGGSGFFGNSAAGGASSRLPRPSIAHGRHRLLPLLRRRRRADVPRSPCGTSGASRDGRGRRSARARPPRSPPASTPTLYKLWAFALAVVHGRRRRRAARRGRRAASPSTSSRSQNSIILLAVVLMGGVYSIWGAVVAALLLRLLPALLDDWGVSTELLTILFGVGVLQVLLTAPGGLVDQVPEGPRQARPARSRGLFRPDGGGGDGVIEITDLTVRFGGVVPIDRMTVTFAARHVRADRAQRRRQDDVLQRAQRLRPAVRRDASTAFGDDLLAMPDFKRPRWGLRRTFQTEQAIANLSVYENVLLVHEHTGGDRSTRRDDVIEAVDFVGLERRRPPARRRPRRRPAPARRGRPGRRRQAAAGPARRAGGRAARRGDRPPRRADPADPRGDRRAGDPRRPRHEPGVGVLRDHRRARLRPPDRLRARPPTCSATSRSSAPTSAPRRSRERDRRSHRRPGRSTQHVRRCDRRAVRAAGGRRCCTTCRSRSRRARSPRCSGPTAPASRTLVLAVAGALRPTSGTVHARRPRPHQAPARADPAGRRRRRPRRPAAAARALGRRQPARGDVLARRATRPSAGIEYALELFPELKQRWRTTARSLSGGEQQMVVLAQALVSQPVGDPRRRAVARARARSSSSASCRSSPRSPSRASACCSSSSSPTSPSGWPTAPTSSRAAASATSGTARELQDDPDLLHSAYLPAGVSTWTQLAGQVAVVTGGASGIGLAMAQRFAAEGMRIVLADIERPVLDRAGDELAARRAPTCSPCRPT